MLKKGIELELTSHDKSSIDLDALVNYIKSIDVHSEEQLLSCANYLHRFSKNSKQLMDIVVNNLSCNNVESVYNPYTEQSLVLFVDKYWSLRLNIWKPLSELPKVKGVSRELYAYDLPHDHNFSFLTVGCFGPGYQTETFKYDHTKVEGVIGEEVSIESFGIKQLQKGHVHYYKESEDIHSQIPPASTSVSLNLLVDPDRKQIREQFRFSITDKSRAVITDLEERRLSTDVEFALSFLNEIDYKTSLETYQRLCRSKSPFIRLAALKNMRLSSEFAEEAEQIIKSDSSKFLQNELR